MGISHRFSFVGFAGALMKIEITDEERVILLSLLRNTMECEEDNKTYVSQLRRIMKKLGHYIYGG